MAKEVKKQCHVMQASLSVGQSDDDASADVGYVLDQKPDVVGLIECTPHRDVIRKLARAADYTPVFHPINSDTGILIKNGYSLKSRGGMQVDPGVSGDGGYPARYLAWISCDFYGAELWFHECHWTARNNRVTQFKHTSQQVAAQVRKHGAGKGVSVFGGDINAHIDTSEWPRELFKDNGLITCYEEFNVAPKDSTGDVLGRYQPDSRIKGTKYRIHPKQKSDHRFLSAYYDIDVAKGAAKDKDVKHKLVETFVSPYDDRPYTTGGNIDWSDYGDNKIYNLPRATETADDQ